MLNVNGTEYYTKDELCEMGYEESEHVIVIATDGWIFEGRTDVDSLDDCVDVRLTNAHVVRKWMNGRGIGGLQSAEYKDEYTLDALPGGVIVHAVVAVLPITEW